MDQQEGDEEAAHAPVAVQERVNGLELSMGESTGNQHRQVGLLMQEPLEVVQGLMHLVDRRRHKGRLLKWDIGRPDPVLRRTELSRLAVAATHPAQKLGVDLSDESE